MIYYNSGLKSIQLFRVRDGSQLANFIVQADLRCINTTFNGNLVVFGTGDGAITCLAINDAKKKDELKSIRNFASRQINLS